VGFFLAGLVTLGSLEAYWLKPLIQSLGGAERVGQATVSIGAWMTFVGTSGSIPNHITASAGFTSSRQLEKMIFRRVARLQAGLGHVLHLGHPARDVRVR
jgi:hypothetical protein